MRRMLPQAGRTASLPERGRATCAAWRAAATSWTRIELHAGQDAGRHRRQRAGQPCLDRGAGQLADEALARRADQQRPPQRPQLGHPGQQLDGLRRRLGEAEARIEDDPLGRDAGRRGPCQRRRSSAATSASRST